MFVFIFIYENIQIYNCIYEYIEKKNIYICIHFLFIKIYIYIHIYIYIYKDYIRNIITKHLFTRNVCCTPCVKQQGLSNAKIRCNVKPELCIG